MIGGLVVTAGVSAIAMLLRNSNDKMPVMSVEEVPIDTINLSMVDEDITSSPRSLQDKPNQEMLDLMSGGWGVGWRIRAGQITDRAINGAAICQMFDNFKNKPDYILVNLSEGADGGKYTSTHSVLDTISRMTPNTDQLMNLVTSVKKNCDLKIIAYAASEGPAKLKHGCGKNAGCKSRVRTWKNIVKEEYGNDSH